MPGKTDDVGLVSYFYRYGCSIFSGALLRAPYSLNMYPALPYHSAYDVHHINLFTLEK